MNFDEIVVKESPGLCRCCLSEGCYKDLGTEYIWMNDTEVYADMLLDCFDIGITQHMDGPNGAKRLICEVCITRLRDACNFKKQVLDSEKRFIDMLGRGEFRPKVLIYQQSKHLKAENIEEPSEELELPEDAEYLDDLEYMGDEEVIKTEVLQSTSNPTTSERPRVSKPKRGRPRKEEDKPTKETKLVKKPKVSKDRASTERRKRLLGTETDTTSTIKQYKIKSENNDITDSDDSNTPILKRSKKRLDKIKSDESVSKILQCFRVRKNVACLLNNTTVIPFSHAKSEFRCFICQEGFHRCDMLQEHFGAEHSSFGCHHRDNIIKKVNKNTSLKLDISKLSCKLCEEPFADLKLIIEHLISEHNIEYDKTAIDIIQPFRLNDEDLRCHICDEKFVYFIKLVSHLNDYHEDKKYMCDICGKSFKDVNSYNIHGWQVHGPGYNCTDCGRRCSNASLLREHMASNHGKGTFKCSECPAEFTSIYKKKKHIISVHKAKDVPASFKCPHCEKVFTCTSQRNVHVRKVHLKEKNEVCPICHAELFNKTRLNLHMVKHLRERNHVCDICGKKYQWKKNLKLHMQKTHSIL